MKWTTKSILAAVLLIAPVTAVAIEAVYPTGSGHRTNYSTSRSVMSILDTLVIERFLVNGESYNIDYLYFSEQLPSAFHIVGYDLSSNGSPMTHKYVDSVPNLTMNGYDTYQWIVSSPDPDDSLAGVVNAGDSVSLRVSLICREAGDYELPLHTSVFSGNGTSFFATATSLSTSVSISVESCCIGITGNVDCDPNSHVDIGDLTIVIQYLFLSYSDLCCVVEADVDGDDLGMIDMSDLNALIDYLFINNTPLRSCP